MSGGVSTPGLTPSSYFLPDASKHCHGFVKRAEIQMTGFLLQFFPADVKANARKMWVCSNHRLKLSHFTCVFGDALHDPQPCPERRARLGKERGTIRNRHGNQAQKRPHEVGKFK